MISLRMPHLTEFFASAEVLLVYTKNLLPTALEIFDRDLMFQKHFLTDDSHYSRQLTYYFFESLSVGVFPN